MHEKPGKTLAGFTSCPAAMFKFLGCVHEPYNSFPGDDQRVLCIACNRFTSEIPHELRGPVLELPEAIQKLVLELTSHAYAKDEPLVGTYRVYRIGKKGLFSDPPSDDDNRRAAFAVAQGNADVLISEAERMNILFSLSTKLRNDRIQVSYLPSDLAKMGTTPVDPASMEAVLNHPAMSPERAKAVRGMLRLGFSPVAVDLDSMLKRIFMRNSTTETAYDGVTVEFTWFD